jgi:hypothetical protein
MKLNVKNIICTLPGTKFGRRMHPNTGTQMVVVEGEMHFDIAGRDPIVARRGSS